MVHLDRMWSKQIFNSANILLNVLSFSLTIEWTVWVFAIDFMYSMQTYKYINALFFF